MVEENGLRADAPVFVPSVGLNENGPEVDVPSGKQRRKRGSRRRQQGRISKESGVSESINQRKKSASSRTRDTPNQMGRRKTEHQSPIKTTSRQRQRQRPRSNHFGGHEGEQKHEIEESLLSLAEESSFPSLSSETNKSNEASNSIWVACKQKPEFFQAQHQRNEKDYVAEPEVDEFAQLGLFQLKPRTARPSKLSEHLESPKLTSKTANNRDHSGETKVQELTKVIHSTISQTHQAQLRIISRRPKWNMDRLRDRWWETLTIRRRHRDLMEEVALCLNHQTVEADVTETESSESSTGSEECYLDPVNTKLAHQDIHGAPNKSALYELLENTAEGSFSSHSDIARDVIKRNDEQALRELLSLHKVGQLSDCLKEAKPESLDATKSQAQSLVEIALHVCVQQDKPHLLRIVLKHISRFSSHDKSRKQEKNQHITPLMMAAELGHGECLLLLLSVQERNSNTVSSRDPNGNNVFHYCCSGQGDDLTLRLLLKDLSVGAKWKQQQLSKTLLTKNKHEKTPLHVACEQGRVDLVEVFLSICSTAILSKMLSMTDKKEQTPLLAAVAANSTDVAICLIMWRGNHNLALRTMPQAPQKSLSSATTGRDAGWSERERPSCPLAWAAEMGNLEMALVLLQFTDSAGSDYLVTEAIAGFLRSRASEHAKIEGVRVLVRAGGNPFLDVISTTGIGKPETAVAVACTSGCTRCLQALIETGRNEVRARQQLRRRDPKLRQQPESFFQAMEGAENEQMNSTLKNALIECLRNGLNHQQDVKYDAASKYFPCAVILYKLGAQIGETDIVQLRASFHATRNGTMDAPLTTMKSRCFVSSFRHYNSESPESLKRVNDLDRSMLAHNSQRLYRMAWIKDEIDRSGCKCPWMSSNWNTDHTPQSTLPSHDKVLLIVGDGEKFVVHSSIASQKSVKLASAIRFAEMKHDAEEECGIPEVVLDLEPRLCRFLLQHIYHGSICTGWSQNVGQVCRDILDLMVIAEEFLCTSLIQECEMRLLSSDPTNCFCWACSKSVLPMCVGDTWYAECMYFVEGPGSLLTGDNMLDILATTQYLERRDFDYLIHVTPGSQSSLQSMPATVAWANAKEHWSSLEALHLLRDAAIQMIISKFSQVVDSESFQESIQLNDVEPQQPGAWSHEVLLLQTCLEQLFESNIEPAQVGNFSYFDSAESSNLVCAISQEHTASEN